MKRSKVIGNDVYGFEPYFDKLVVIATIYHENKEVRPTHGYFAPHRLSRYTKSVSKRLGYNFNNN